jgi:hypothetical protein
MYNVQRWASTSSRWRAKWSFICSEWWCCSKCWLGNLWKTARNNFRTSCEFPQISHFFFYEIITVKLCYRDKFCARWVPKMLTGGHKTQKMASVLAFLERYHKDDDEFLSHMISRCWNQRAVKTVDAHTFTKLADKVLTNVICQKGDGSCFLGYERVLMVEFKQQWITITSKTHCKPLKKTA